MKFQPLPGLSIATLIALVILLSLGTWQLQRRVEKHELLDQMEARKAQAAAPVELLIPVGDYAAFRKATALGEFDHTREAFVSVARTDNGPTEPGFKVLTPFRLTGGDIILVDRGWIPQANRPRATRLKGQSAGVVELEGALRKPSLGSSFTPPPDTTNRIFYARDSAAIAEFLGITLRTNLIFEATTKVDGGPEPRATAEKIPDNHLNYALTWYSLAIVLLAIYFIYHHRQGRLRFRA